MYHQVRRMSNKSALFVTGRNAQSQFAVFTPNTEFKWVKENRNTLETVYNLRNNPLDIDVMIKELEMYAEVKKNVEKLILSRETISHQIKESKTKSGELHVVLLNRLKEKKKSLRQIKETLWDFEEELLPKLLKLQNCDSNSTFKEKLYFTQTKGFIEDFQRKGHKELSNLNDLVEWSSNSHTAFYLKHGLALVELKLNNYFASKFLASGFEAFSNPDFTKSVIVEGCGVDFLNANEVFSLKKYQDFGDRTSCNAMHLVGGASLYPFVAYFARNILQNPQILPITCFCLGRYYTPQPESECDLFNSQQSQAVQLYSVSATQQEMEEQLENLLKCFVEVLGVFPNFTITELSLEHCDVCNSRQFSIDMQGVKSVNVGNVAVQGSYISKRVMMVGQKPGPDNYIPMYTVSGHLNLTKVLGVLVELVQEKDSKVDCGKIIQWVL